MRDLYEAAGAVFNDETGFWELNGLTDITQKQMDEIYRASSTFYMKEDCQNFASGLSIRTNLCGKENVTDDQCSFSAAGRNNPNLEVFRINYKSPSSSLQYLSRIESLANAFSNCAKLKTILGVLKLTPSCNLINIFDSTPLLRDVFFAEIATDLDISGTPKLSYDSLKYLVDNAANTDNITVTVHPTTYGFLTGSSAPTSEVGGTAEEWTALMSQALEKNISFATTE